MISPVVFAIHRLPGFFEGTGMPDAGWWERCGPDPSKMLRDVGVTPNMDVVDLCSGDVRRGYRRGYY
jgi:hypothetical protein